MTDDRPRHPIVTFFANAAHALIELGGHVRMVEEREQTLTVPQHEDDERFLRDKGEAL
jgi:hypothetical protein